MDEKDSPVIFGEWLKLRRKALDMTQDELARRAACSVGALRKIESGERRPSKQLAALLAQALEIPNEDQGTFIRVARGELNLERLQSLEFAPARPSADLWTLGQPRRISTQIASVKTPEPAYRIPHETTPLIGRENELAALERLFSDPQCRLLTLTGVGGIGKTRLAIGFASRNLAFFPGGVFYIPLASVNSPEKIVSAMADVLDFGFSGPAEPKMQLLNYLSSNIKQKAMIIFDNLEHLLVQTPNSKESSYVVDLVLDILLRIPNIDILGTSRERLNIHGEWIYELHGLAVPQFEYPGRLEDYTSIALFLNSARRINPDFQATADDQRSLIHICQLVDGVPLAIELAAAWVCLLSCGEIAQEIQSNMDFLTSTMRDIPERHRSIRATFDHSWKLLTDEECGVLCQLSIFQGGFERDAAYQVAGATLSLLQSLNNKSLIRRTESGRYDLHEVIRQYALSHLDRHPHKDETYDRYCEYYLSFLGARERSFKSSAQQEAIRQITDEIDNIRAAWAWAITREKYSMLSRAGKAYGWYFEIAGLYREGIDQFEPLAQVLKDRQQEEDLHRLFGLALTQKALLTFRKGENEKALKLYEESVAVLRSAGDATLLAEALIFLGIILHLFGEYHRAKSLLEEGLALAQESNERWFEAYAIYNLGYIASLLGQYTEGHQQMLGGLTIWRDLGDPHYIALGLNFLVPTLIKLGLHLDAKSYMHESIALCEQSKNRWGMATAYRYLGVACSAEGEYSEAQAYLLKSLEIFGEYFKGWHTAISLAYLGHATMMAGDYDLAKKYFLESLQSANEEKAIPIVLDALSGLSCLLEEAGKAEIAYEVCQLILSHPSGEDATKERAMQQCSSLEQTLSSKMVKKAQQAGEEKTLDEIVAVVLEAI